MRLLHDQFMRGELMQSELADLLGISRVDFIHLLESLGLPANNI
ncbi:MAG TPA: hypothetical protein VKQ72_16065 [Aggregatilineales bacterium]|nr:hypothetical protein [Aggregatilineales bacterium]